MPENTYEFAALDAELARATWERAWSPDRHSADTVRPAAFQRDCIPPPPADPAFFRALDRFLSTLIG